MIRRYLEKLVEIIFHNFAYKVMSVFLAIIVWAIIQGEQIQEINRDILVTVHVDEGYGVRGDLVRVKSATIRGPQAWLLEVPKKLSADVFVPSGRVGRYRMRLSKDDTKNLNERLELIIHEPYLDLFVDRMMERTVPVKEAIHGSPAEGYIVEKVSIEPKAVLVKGIRSDLLQLRYIYTEPIDVSGLQESRIVESKLVSPGLGEDALAMEAVRVSLQVGDSKINKRFGDIPVEVIGAEGPTSVKPNLVSIMVQGVPGVLNFIKKSDFKAFVEVRGLSPGRYEQDIKVKIPADTVLIETFPEKGIVHIDKR